MFVTSQPPLDGTPINSALRLDTVTYGLPLLAALITVTQAESILAKLRALLIGVGVMAVLTVPTVMAWAKLTSLEADERTPFGTGERSSLLYYAFHGYAFSQPVIAVAIWVTLMVLGVFKVRKTEPAPQTRIARNAACPCGSGRKYKRCCGRTASDVA